MAKYIRASFKFIILFSLICIFPSCQIAKESYMMTRGYLAFTRGDYQDALLSYLDIENITSDYHMLSYNIGVIYQALDQEKSLKKWLEAEKSDNAAIKVSALYNIGLYYYNSGKYQEAYTYFLQALKISPADMDIKINLELAYQRLIAISGTTSSADVENKKQKTRRSENSYILQYLKKKEQDRWKSGELTPDVNTSNDW
ncbi:tetratricopeptide repeat protein [Spirochaetia bacterium 38H-sp]|uniref:Tetratricopeptide repeat protein n=1 Tax=Rarispira pelagica TaxID=3141764 RepID=A0ABU9UCI4_9SPIR